MSEEILEYLERVRTYKLGKWAYRSHRLTPYLLASRGFKAVSATTSECHICQVQVNFERLPIDEDDEKIEHELQEQLAHHKQDCPYGQSEQSLFRLTRQLLYSEMDDIFNRAVDSYKFYKGRLPFITEEVWQKYFRESEQVFAKLSERFNQGKEVNLPQVLAISGWQFQPAASKPTLQCLFCGRSIAIDKFASTDQHQQKIVNDRVLKSTEKSFDVIEEHRYFCFWGNSESKELVQNPKLYGWQICLRHLQDKSLEVDKGWARTNKFEEVAKAKQQFNKLLDNFTNKTRQNVKRFNQLLADSKQLLVDQKQLGTFDDRASATRQSLEGMMKELGEVRAGPKKIKLA